MFKLCWLREVKSKNARNIQTYCIVFSNIFASFFSFAAPTIVITIDLGIRQRELLIDINKEEVLQILPLFDTGATPSQYGLVFGLSPLTAFTFAPIFGRYGSRFGLKHLFNSGVFMYALAGLAFGFLDFVDNVNIFLGFSYFLRYFEFLEISF